MTNCYILRIAYLCSLITLVLTIPLPMPEPLPAGGTNQELDVLQIPLSNGKELDVLTLGTKDQEELIAERNKRTIGLLRELFPDITKNVATDTQIDLSAINKQLEETIRVARQVKEAEAAAQAAAQATASTTESSTGQQSQQSSQAQEKSDTIADTDTIQLSFNNEISPISPNNELQLGDGQSAALNDLTLDDDTVDLDDRNKRFLTSIGTGNQGGNSGGATNTAGSGNFLFDIVRLFSGSVQTQTGDAAANSVSNTNNGNDGSDNDANRANDGFTEGIPGPVTRLVVLANRGLANLIQDLILRVAATSEKFVNFKAKLITALI